MVAPLVASAGTNIKILEAMATGTPIVCTPKALRALHAQPGKDLLVSDDADGFARAVLQIMEDQDLQCQLREAGITVALKNLSHGLVNNVNRSHISNSNNACGMFIPTVVDIPIIRQKTVLNIIDGVMGAYHGGPGSKVGKYLWEHKTMYFATDPVAVDRNAWTVIINKREQSGMKPIALAYADDDSVFTRMQPEFIEIAGALGLGESDEEKIDLKRVKLA